MVIQYNWAWFILKEKKRYRVMFFSAAPSKLYCGSLKTTNFKQTLINTSGDASLFHKVLQLKCDNFSR